MPRDIARMKARRKVYYAENKDAINARRRAKRLANPQAYRDQVNAYRDRNRPRFRAVQKAWIERNRQHVREYNRDFKAKLIGVSSAWYEAQYRAQLGKCAICGDRHERLCIDHHHRTQKARALLCAHCNRGLGYFRETPHNMRAAAAYVERFSQ